jgi:signal transduction histidine kinase
MGHELRTPLNAIIGFSEIIKSEIFGPVGEGKYTEYANHINMSGQHLLNLINDILDLSKVEHGEAELNQKTLDVPQLIRSVVELVQQSAGTAGIELASNTPDDLPALRADERKLKQILVNLLSNVIKFTKAGGKVALKARCGTVSGHVFQISDTGIGIAPEDISKAMSHFGQVDGDLNRRYEGTGLGLPLANALVELHGGSLDIQSQLGVGTTVTVRFPADRIVRRPEDAHSPDEVDRKAG